MKYPNRSILLLLLIGGLITFFACSKNKDKGPSDELPADKVVTASIRGRVLDESGLPVAGAAVSGGTAQTLTDVNGTFSFKDIQTSSRWGFVKVSKTGYFTGSRTVVTEAGGSNYVTISLIPKIARGSFGAGSGGAVMVESGDTVNFSGTSVVDAATHAAYTGTVHVYAAYLDPTDANLSNIMPGDLRGVGADGRETGLQSFGMMAVELVGDGGEKLQLAGAGSGQVGGKATLTMQIPAALQATAPSTIPLWYFNDSTGKWIEEGTATRQGNSYVGQVSHFSFWNCDAPSAVVNFTVHLKDQQGRSLANTEIEFVSPTLGTRGGYTDSTGYAHGMVPRGESLLFRVLNPCGTAIFTENFGPVLADQDLGTKVVTTANVDLQLSGTVVDCSGNAVTSGYVNAILDGLYYGARVQDGHFTLVIHRCSASSAEVQLTASDNATSQQGTASAFVVTKGSKDVGELIACGVSTEEHVSFVLNGDTYQFLALQDTILTYRANNLFMIEAERKDFKGPYCVIRIKNLERAGEYSAHPSEWSTGFTPDGKEITYYSLTNTATSTVTSYGAIGEFIEGRFSGTIYLSPTGEPFVTSGSFRVRRTN